MKIAFVVARCFIVSILLMAPGCGATVEGIPRRPVEGTVSYKSKPVPYGTIQFIPQPDGPVASAVIQDGKYQCDHKFGVAVGPVRIEIIALPQTEGMSDEELLSKGSPTTVQIPPKYNSASELQETVPAGKDHYVLNFDLL